MADDETVLTSFVAEDESLVDTWEVRGVGEGTSRVPPAIDSGELLAITDRRLMWFDGELFDVDLTAETDVEYRDYTHTTTPTIVSVGWLLFALSAFATAGAFLFLDVDAPTATLPVASGLGVVLLAIVVARARGEGGQDVDLHRLVVENDDDVATIWCESEDLKGLQAAIGDELADDDGDGRKHGDDGVSDEDSDGLADPVDSPETATDEKGTAAGPRGDDEPTGTATGDEPSPGSGRNASE